MRDIIAYFIFTAIMLVAVFTVFADTQTEDLKRPGFSLEAEAVKSRLENVHRLVNTSSGARRVAEGSPEVRALRDRAAAHLNQAETFYGKGDMQKANDELQMATLDMFQAIRAVGTGKLGEDKLREDYMKKRRSLESLLEAFERVSLEKGSDPINAGAIKQQAEKADDLLQAGKLREAQIELDSAYDTVKMEVEKLRSGDTLVRSLNFANAEEEYAYELDRNETHQMLVRLLLDDKQLDDKAQSQIDAFLEEASNLRNKAEDASSKGHYSDGIHYLEESTKQLVRAIRRAGVYIPG